MEKRKARAMNLLQNVSCLQWLVGNAFHATRLLVKSVVITGIVPLRDQLVMETVQRRHIAGDPGVEIGEARNVATRAGDACGETAADLTSGVMSPNGT
jgi:hypothetical protein